MDIVGIFSPVSGREGRGQGGHNVMFVVQRLRIHLRCCQAVCFR